MEPKVVINELFFNRIMLNVKGEISGFEHPEKLSARFVSDDGKIRLHPQHFEVVDGKFSLIINVLSCNKEQPIDTGNYYLKIYEKYSNKFDKLKNTAKTRTFSQFASLVSVS